MEEKLPSQPGPMARRTVGFARFLSLGVGAAIIAAGVHGFIVFRPAYGVLKAVAAVAGMFALAVPFLRSGITGRGEVLADLESSLIRRARYIESYHSGKELHHENPDQIPPESGRAGANGE